MPTVITSKNITEGKLRGTGSFDVWMQATKEHLEYEYSKNRIKGTDYATVYLGAIQSLMAQSTAFELQRHQAAAQTDLTLEQVSLTSEQIKIAKLEQDKLLVDIAIGQKQVLKLAAEIANTQQQTLIGKEQELNLKAERELILANVEIAKQNKINLVSTNNLIISNKAKVDAETQLVIQNIEVAKETILNLKVQNIKLTNEATLLAHKCNTERSQYSDTGYLIDWTGTVTAAPISITGVTGKQKALYQAQIDGFSRSAEHKVAKLMADTWAVRNSGDSTGNAVNGINLLNDDHVGAAISKMLTNLP